MLGIHFYFFLYTALIGSKYIFSFHDVYIPRILRDCYHIPFNHPLAKLYIVSSFHLPYVRPSFQQCWLLSKFLLICQHLSGTNVLPPLINILGTHCFPRIPQRPLLYKEQQTRRLGVLVLTQ